MSGRCPQLGAPSGWCVGGSARLAPTWGHGLPSPSPGPGGGAMGGGRGAVVGPGRSLGSAPPTREGATVTSWIEKRPTSTACTGGTGPTAERRRTSSRSTEGTWPRVPGPRRCYGRPRGGGPRLRPRSSPRICHPIRSLRRHRAVARRRRRPGMVVQPLPREQEPPASRLREVRTSHANPIEP